jgi:lysophospholipase L1-like esterase
MKRALAVLLLTAAALPAGAAHAAANGGAPLFAWSMPSRFGATDAQGRVIETQPGEVRKGPWEVDFHVLGKACAEGARYRWTVDGRPAKMAPAGECAFRHRFPTEGGYTVGLSAEVGARRLTDSRRIAVQDLLIVSIGDSVASGEGAPEDGGWQSERCHRSALAGPALAARRIEEADPHTSVTFVHLACSGAEVRRGLLGGYEGAVPPDGEPPLPPQVEELERVAHRRKVDAVLLSIGANDIHFSEFVAFCANPLRVAGDCFARTYTKLGGDGTKSAAQVATEFVEELPELYGELAAALPKSISPSQVHIVEYFDPTRDADGEPCGHILDIRRPNVVRAEQLLFEPLNAAVTRAAEQYHWDEVGGVSALFRGHGYCAHDERWVSSLLDSLRRLGGLRGRHRGTLHPNERGYEETSKLIAANLERDFFRGRTLTEPPQPPPAAAAPGSSGGLDLRGVGVILAGLLLGAAILAFPRVALLLARPFVSLLKTFRPLLLPLLVVIAVGTVKWSLLAQVLINAALLVLAWTLIVIPEAAKSGVTLRMEERLAMKIGLHGLVAVVVGGTAVIAIRLLGLDSPYFAAIGDIPSGLLLLAVLLWAAAFALRLFSFATTALRSALAFDIGLALLVLGVSLGVLPGGETIHDAWPVLFAIFAASALLLLCIDAVRGAIAAWPPPAEEGAPGKDGPPLVPLPIAGGAADAPEEPGRPLTSRAAGLGFSAAAVAAVVIAVSTGAGMIAAAEKGQALNPPEDDSVAATTPDPARIAGGGKLALAWKYAPVLAFTKAEHWTPIAVGSYLEHATLSGPPGTPRHVRSAGELPSSCPEFGVSRCYTLSIECDDGDPKCAGYAPEHPRNPEQLYADGAAYVRVLERGSVPGYEPRGSFAGGGPFGERLGTLIQYWFFYYYDEWKAPVFAGLLTQRHEGDWEAVTIGLDRERRPLFAADSAHCSGSWRPWSDIEASTLPPGPRIHPLVAVAEGSHANYPAAAQKRSPDWAHCAGAPAGVTTAISFASNIRDKTEYGWPWYPGRLIPVDARTPPMSFPGTWGADDRTTLRNFRSNPLGKPGLGPKTPTLQALWQEPVRTIFCGSYVPRRCAPE